MTTVRRRRKVSNPSSRVTRRSRVAKQSVVCEGALKPYWKPLETVERNFSQVGLASRLNNDLRHSKIQRDARDWNWKRAEAVREGRCGEFYDSEDEVIQELNSLFAKEPNATAETGFVAELERTAVKAAETIMERKKLGKPLTEHEQEYIEALVAKHGDDFCRMFMDIKLNYRQLTASQLRKLAASLNK